jgi:hypothetical protein
MKRSDLEHIIRAAGDVIGEDRVIIVGSQSILASFPEQSLPPEAARSLEADVLPLDDPSGAKADKIDGVLGEFSPFDEEFGIHADGVSETTSILPDGWRDRLISVTNSNTNGVTGLCLERHDLCVAKLAAGREKDLEFVGALLRAGIVDHEVLLGRIDSAAIPEDQRGSIKGFVRRHRTLGRAPIKGAKSTSEVLDDLRSER